MNDKNFDHLKNLKAPESWIENAINIPNTEDKQKPVFFLRYSRSLAAVACLVIVCAISLIIALNRDDNVLPIEPSDKTVTTDATIGDETQIFTDATESVTSENKQPATNSDRENGGAPFEGTIDNSDSLNKPTAPSQKPDSDPTSSDTTDVTPTENPVIKPTDLPTVKPTKPPTEKPTARPPDSDKPNTPQAPESPGDPYEPPTDGEGEGSSNPHYVFYTSFSTGYLDSSMQIYCSVLDPDGNIVVNYDLATVYSIYNNLAYVSYALPSYAITNSGRYCCNFYTANGEHICSSIIYVQV
ncbi:MAG: hypothetical protein IJO20_05915 [Ruminococcus sp.]|nr:hypothetical protein [Ruminococcus sp.]